MTNASIGTSASSTWRRQHRGGLLLTLGFLAVSLASLRDYGQTTTERGVLAVAGVEAAVANFAEAFAKADVVALHSMLTADYVHTNLDGTVHSRTTWLSWVASRRRSISEGAVVFDLRSCG